MEDACGQRFWIECDNPDRAASTDVSMKQGPRGKRGSSGLKGTKGEKGDSGEFHSDAEEIADLKTKYIEMKQQLLSVPVIHEEIKSQSKLLRGAQEGHDELLKRLEGRLENIEAKMASIIANNYRLCTKSTFSITPTAGSFSEVQAMCKANGGDLATSPFESGGDQFYGQIHSLIISHGGSSLYVGIHDRNVEGRYELINGKTFNSGDPSLFGSWYSGEPNNYGGNEDCTIWSKPHNGLGDDRCYTNYKGLCETLLNVC